MSRPAYKKRLAISPQPKPGLNEESPKLRLPKNSAHTPLAAHKSAKLIWGSKQSVQSNQYEQSAMTERKKGPLPKAYIDLGQITNEGDFEILDDEESVAVNLVRKSITIASNPNRRVSQNVEKGSLTARKASVFNDEENYMKSPLSSRLIYPQKSRKKHLNGKIDDGLEEEKKQGLVKSYKTLKRGPAMLFSKSTSCLYTCPVKKESTYGSLEVWLPEYKPVSITPSLLAVSDYSALEQHMKDNYTHDSYETPKKMSFVSRASKCMVASSASSYNPLKTFTTEKLSHHKPRTSSTSLLKAETPRLLRSPQANIGHIDRLGLFIISLSQTYYYENFDSTISSYKTDRKAYHKLLSELSNAFRICIDMLISISMQEYDRVERSKPYNAEFTSQEIKEALGFQELIRIKEQYTAATYSIFSYPYWLLN